METVSTWNWHFGLKSFQQFQHYTAGWFTTHHGTVRPQVVQRVALHCPLEWRPIRRKGSAKFLGLDGWKRYWLCCVFPWVQPLLRRSMGNTACLDGIFNQVPVNKVTSHSCQGWLCHVIPWFARVLIGFWFIVISPSLFSFPMTAWLGKKYAICHHSWTAWRGRKLAVLETKEKPAVVLNNNPSRDPHPCLNHSQGWNAVDGARFQDQIGCGLWSSLARCPGCFRVRCLVEHTTMGDTACEWGRWKMWTMFDGGMMQDRGPIAT